MAGADRAGRKGREFNILMDWWMKLLASLVVLDLRLLYLFLEGRGLIRLCAGWVSSLTIVKALQVRRVV